MLLREGSKRIESFFSEHFFVKQLCAHIPSRLVGLNWFYCEAEEGYIFIRYFGKSASTTLTIADRHFARVLTAAGFKVVLVHYCENEVFMAGTVDPVREDLSIKLDRKTWQPAVDLFLSISGRPSPAVYKGAGNTDPRDNSLARVLWSLLQEDAERLVLTRRFVYDVLYAAFHQQPVDIDAIVLRQGAPVCLEFKRKGPAKGKWVSRTGVQPIDFNSLRTHCNLALESVQTDGAYDFQELRKRVASALRKAGFNRVITPSFGLDIYPHSRFVQLCEQLRAGYFQINWCRPNDNSSDFIDAADWTFKGPEDLYAAWIRPIEFNGFNFTVGVDSGMNNGLRFQETLDLDFYEHFSSSTDLRPVFDYLMEAP